VFRDEGIKWIGMMDMTEVKKKQKLRRWTEVELEFLKESYGKIDIIELSNFLNRAPSATRNKAYEIGISKSSRAWTAKEEKDLREFYPTWEESDLENYFNRTFSGISGKATKLKIGRVNSNHYTYEQVQSIFEDEDCVLVSREYINSKTNLDFICHCGRDGVKVLSEFLISSQCRECGLENGADKRRYTYKQVVDIFSERECKLISSSYKGNGSRLVYICHCGNERVGTLNNFLTRKGCVECWNERRVKYTEDYVRNIVELEGCTYIEQDKESVSTNVAFICSCGNYGRVLVKSFMMGSRCIECGKESYRKNNSGENHLNWNPNITDKERKEKRNYPEYVLWRTAVYERDNYTCQCCGKYGGSVDAHHKDSYHWCKERRVDVSNGIVLCQECHILGDYGFHKLYGYKNNTEAQFQEWIETYQSIILYSNERIS
jgi:5-methylcytosine-specific restriction endonuclease McrA